MKTTQEEADRVKRRIGEGWTCYRYITAEPLYDGYLMIHHKSHPSWVNRFTGSVTCESWHMLVHVSTERPKGLMENAALIHFRGRMTKERMKLVYDKIEFEKNKSGKVGEA